MPIRKYKPEQVVALLRQEETGLANGKTTRQDCEEAEITAQTSNSWRKEFGRPKRDQAQRLKELEREYAKLRRLVVAPGTKAQGYLREINPSGTKTTEKSSQDRNIPISR